MGLLLSSQGWESAPGAGGVHEPGSRPLDEKETETGLAPVSGCLRCSVSKVLLNIERSFFWVDVVRP